MRNCLKLMTLLTKARWRSQHLIILSTHFFIVDQPNFCECRHRTPCKLTITVTNYVEFNPVNVYVTKSSMCIDLDKLFVWILALYIICLLIVAFLWMLNRGDGLIKVNGINDTNRPGHQLDSVEETKEGMNQSLWLSYD